MLLSTAIGGGQSMERWCRGYGVSGGEEGGGEKMEEEERKEKERKRGGGRESRGGENDRKVRKRKIKIKIIIK